MHARAEIASRATYSTKAKRAPYVSIHAFIVWFLSRLSVNEDYIQTGDRTFESGRRATSALRKMSDRPTAIPAASDEVALGGIAESCEQGQCTPRDIGAMGFDDIDIARRGASLRAMPRRPRF
ncbi:MAG: substrate-binding domain-containing protein [Christensenellales bacterium]